MAVLLEGDFAITANSKSAAGRVVFGFFHEKAPTGGGLSGWMGK